MSARSLAGLILLLVFAQASREAEPAFGLAVIAGFAVLALRFQILPRLLGRPLPPSVRRIVNGVLAALLPGGMVFLFFAGIHGDLYLPIVLTAAVWMILDQPASRVVDALYVGLAGLAVVVALAITDADDALTLAASLLAGGLLLTALSRLDRDRILEDAPLIAPGPASRFAEMLPITGLAALGVVLALGASWYAWPEGGAAAEARRAVTKLTGFTDVVRLGSLGRLKSSDQTVMELSVVERRAGRSWAWRHEGDESGPPLLLRGSVLDRFDGRRFTRSADLRDPPEFGRGARGIRRRTVDQEIRLAPHFRCELFALMEVIEFNGPGVIDAVGGIRSSAPVENRIAYEVWSEMVDPDSGVGLDEIEIAHPDPRYRALPWLDPAVQDLARSIVGGRSGDRARALAVQEFLREAGGFRYSRVDRNDPRRPMEAFLLETREGHCEYFAGAMVVLLRSLDLPARLACGFRGGTFSESLNGYRVLGRDAHAWVELPFPGAGWIAFDPTPPETLLDADLREAVAEEPRGDQGDPLAALSTVPDGPVQPPPGWLFAGVAGVVLLGLGLRLLGRRARPAGEPKLGRRDRSLQGRLLSVLQRAGARPRASATLRELLSEARALGAEARVRVGEVVAMLYRRRYGGVTFGAEEEEAARRVLVDVDAALD